MVCIYHLSYYWDWPSGNILLSILCLSPCLCPCGSGHEGHCKHTAIRDIIFQHFNNTVSSHHLPALNNCLRQLFRICRLQSPSKSSLKRPGALTSLPGQLGCLASSLARAGLSTYHVLPQNSYCTAYLESGRYRDLYIDFVFQLAVLCFMPMRAACL